MDRIDLLFATLILSGCMLISAELIVKEIRNTPANEITEDCQ